MMKYLVSLFLLIAFPVMGANPTFSSFNTNFSTAGNVVGLNTIAAQRVAMLDMNTLTGLQGYDSMHNATAAFAGQMGYSYYDQENVYFWKARTTTKGDWFKVMGISGGGNFVAGDFFSMSTNAGGMNYFITGGNPVLQTTNYVSVDFQNVAVDANPFNSGGGWLAALTSTNSHSGTWTVISTNIYGQVIYKGPDTFISFLAVNEQAPPFDLPGYGLIVQNGNDPLAIAQSRLVGTHVGNYSYLLTQPSANLLHFPDNVDNAFNPSSNGWKSTTKEMVTGNWNFSHDITVSNIVYAGPNKAQITLASGLLNPGAMGDQDMTLTTSRITANNFYAGLGGAGTIAYNIGGGYGMGVNGTALRFYLGSTLYFTMDTDKLRMDNGVSLLMGTDGSGDIGASGSGRPNNAYIKTSVTIGGIKISSGTGSPNGAVTGSVGDQFNRTDGGASTTLYIKESGTATTSGWVGK